MSRGFSVPLLFLLVSVTHAQVVDRPSVYPPYQTPPEIPLAPPTTITELPQPGVLMPTTTVGVPVSPPTPPPVMPAVYQQPVYETIYPGQGTPGRPLGPTQADVFTDFLVWGGVDYSLWSFRRTPLAVPLVTSTNSPPGPGANILGIDPKTYVVIGPSQFDSRPDPFSGGRAWFGFWFDCQRSLGFEFAGLWVEGPTETLSVSSSPGGWPMYGRPVNLTGIGAGVYDIAYPGVVAGSFQVANRQLLRGLEGNFVGYAFGGPVFNAEVLLGARWVNFEERLDLNYEVNNLVPLPAFGGDIVPTGTSIRTLDGYRAINNFYGGQIGGKVEGNFGRFSVIFTGKVAFGVNDMTMHVDGSTYRSDTRTTYGTGVLANTANSGEFRENHYAFVPEGNLSFGWWVTPRFRLHAGYNILYISSMVRPGAQVSNMVNPAAVAIDPTYNPAGVNRVSPSFMRSDFWAEGVTLGFDFRF